MDENLRETTELPGSGGTAPNEGNEPETKSIRFVPSAYDPRDCRYHLEPAADDDDPDESLREKRARLGWEYVCRTASSISGAVTGLRTSPRRRTVRIPTATEDCVKSCAAAIFCR